MQSNPLADISLQQLNQAIAIREKIEKLETELGRMLGDQSGPTAAPNIKRKKRKMSVAARAKISAAAKARWAKRKGPRRMSRPVAVRTKKPSPRAPLKERIVQTLKTTGKSGVTVKDLAAKLGKSYGNISVWFHTTGKAVKEIKKVAPGKFAWAS
jgi:hypothetical protein